jgi:hypothetical protein
MSPVCRFCTSVGARAGPHLKTAVAEGLQAGIIWRRGALAGCRSAATRGLALRLPD